MQFVRQWLFQIVLCTALVSFSRQIVREGEGAVAEAVRFCGGLVLLLCLLQPLGEIEFRALDMGKETFQVELAQLQEVHRDELNSRLAESIAQRTGAYIEDKAAERGETICAEVTVREQNGVFLPAFVTLYGKRDEAFSLWLAQELGIPSDGQEWREER